MRGDGTSVLCRERPAFYEFDSEGLRLGSISNERTFHANVGDEQRVLEQLLRLTERVCWRARKRGVRARTISLKLRCADFQTVTRSMTGEASDEDAFFLVCVAHLYIKARRQTRRSKPRAVRLVGIALTNLVRHDAQLQLPFAPRRPIGGALDVVRANHLTVTRI